jgi:hypothetical protein
LVDRIEFICKHHKDVKCEDFQKLYEQTMSRYPQFKEPLKNCIGNVKMIIEECISLIYKNLKVTNKIQLEWFKSFMGTLVEGLKIGLYIGQRLIKNFITVATRSFPEYLMALITATVLCGTIGAIVMIAIGMWVGVIQKRWKAIKDYFKDMKDWVSDTVKREPLEDEETIPEELQPPKAQKPVINITMVNMTESTNLTESLEMVGAILFVLFLKAAIAKRLSDELHQKMEILKYLFTPTAALTTFLTMLVYLASNGVVAV